MGRYDEKCARWLAKNDAKDIEEAEKELAKKTTKQDSKASLEDKKWQGPPDEADAILKADPDGKDDGDAEDDGGKEDHLEDEEELDEVTEVCLGKAF